MKLKTILACALALFVFSCKKDGSDADNNSLIGKWRYVGNYQSTGGPETFAPAANNQVNDYVQFSTSGQIQSDYFLGSTTYKTSGTNSLTINFINPVNQGEYIYSIKKDTLSIGSNGCIEGCSVVFVKE